MSQVREATTSAWDEVIERASSMDLDALDRIVERYTPRLFGFFRRLVGSRVEAEDLVQEVFVRVVRKICHYEHRGRFDAWLFRIASNVGRDHLRRVTRSVEFPAGDANAADTDVAAAQNNDISGAESTTPARQAELADERDRLQEALGRLPLPERQVILLRHYGSLSFAEIARQMGTPLGTALARAHRGLARLRTMMETTA
jgi:RNA polymerase sigma-70 factor (ECF subfamily)